MYLAVVGENTRKNLAFGLVQRVSPSKTSDDFTWIFTPAAAALGRVLRISILGLTSTERAALTIACENQFGSDKVVVA